MEYVDVYRVLSLFEVTDPCIQHAIKKLLVAGNRGHKNLEKDVQEAIVSLERWKEMRSEEGLNVFDKNTIDLSHKFNKFNFSEIDYGVNYNVEYTAPTTHKLVSPPYDKITSLNDTFNVTPENNTIILNSEETRPESNTSPTWAWNAPSNFGISSTMIDMYEI